MAIALIVSAVLIYQAGRFYVAWEMGRSSDPDTQARGARLEGNAEAWDRLGDALASNFADAQPGRAQVFLERAVELDPRSARFWTDLAQVYEEEGSVSKARFAYEQAESDYPISANVAWRFGNFLLRQGDTSRGFAEIRRALQSDSSLAPLAISRVWNSEPDVGVALHQVLPYDRGLYLEALNFFAAKHEDAAALETWNQILGFGGKPALGLSSVFPLVDELIASDRTADAQAVWQQALRASHWLGGVAADTNSLIWNGGFELPVANGGLDWRLDQESGHYISIDSSQSHSGTHSLRVDFTGGENLDFQGVQQFVPVKPGAAYTLRYFMKTRSISTDSGLRFEVLDQNHHEVNLDTVALTGTNSWTLESCRIVTGPDTHFLDLRLRRFPSRLFDNKLSGTVWVDDVSLTLETSTKTHP